MPSFGSVRLTLHETTLTNSEGLHRRFAHTMMEYEFAIKSSGGAEGAAPGEHWVNARGAPPARPTPEIARDVERWCVLARDVRTASAPVDRAHARRAPSSGPRRHPPRDRRVSGSRGPPSSARWRRTPGTTVGASVVVTSSDDGLLPFGLGTAPCDDEGTSQSRRPLIEGGVARGSIEDLLHASALGRIPDGQRAA